MRLPNGKVHDKSTYILGVDPARTGADESALVVLEQLHNNENVFISYIEALHTPDLTELIGKIIYLDGLFHFKKIIVDETGLGAGVSDTLKKELKTRVEGIWYTQKTKAELFNNLKLLMNKKDKRLIIPDFSISNDSRVRKMFYQFLSIKYELKEGNKVPKISHDEREHDDIINALALAASYFNVGRKIKRSYGLVGTNYT